MQAFRGTDDAALTGDTDKVMQMLVVKHGDLSLFVFFEQIPNYYLFVTNYVDLHNPPIL